MTIPPPPLDADGGSPDDGATADATAGPLDDLVEAAHRTHVVVVGGGIAGLVAALGCAKVGLRVTLLEAAPQLGGTVRAGEVGDIELDLGPDGWARGGGDVRRLVDELGLGDRVTPASSEGPWVAGAPFGAAPLPSEQVAGIPANAWDPAVRRIIGWRGVWRAYLDRLRPPLTIGAQRNLGSLVRGRMGDLVVDRLIAPVSVGRYALRPDEIDVEFAAPGLSTALTRTGSLGGAVSQLLATPAPGFDTLEGGLHALVPALLDRLADLDVEVRVDTAVQAIERVNSAPDAAARGRWQVSAGVDRETITADAVVMAASESEARRLLAPHVGAVTPEAAVEQDVVTLVVEQPALDAHPRGQVVYPLPGQAPVASVAHVTARWPWLGRLGTSVHVLRVSFPPAAGAARDDAALLSIAVAEASALLGVPLPDGAIRGARTERFTHAPPTSALGLAARQGALRAAVHAVPGLSVVGAWVAGSGLAAVVPDAAAAAERVRRSALFGPSSLA